jgi:predicted RNA binding protein YcfA (HicA-like mRNA interferase family)
MKVRDVILMVEADGWRQVWQTGSHRQFKHSQKKGLVTIAGNVEVPTGTLKSILRQAGLEK